MSYMNSCLVASALNNTSMTEIIKTGIHAGVVKQILNTNEEMNFSVMISFQPMKHGIPV